MLDDSDLKITPTVSNPRFIKEQPMQARSKRFLIMTIAGVLAAWGLTRTASAVDIVDDPVQIDDRAAQILQTSNSLCWEMYRYHQQQPGYAQSYRTAKDLWRQAGALRDALVNGPLETESLQQQVSQMNDLFVRLDQDLAKWGDGDRSSIPMNGRPGARTVVTDGVVLDLPLIGVQVGGPRYEVIDDGTPALQRRRLHPNSRGSRRSLERELAAVKQAMSYLLEDAGVSGDPQPPTPGVTAPGPVPNPPDEGKSQLGPSVKVQPRVKK
jgi:hypothetical protein